jgi:hypothetical protein
LKQVWEQQYKLDAGQIRHRELKEMAPVREWIRSPFDVEARYGKKRHRHWIGYKVHLTETCDEGQPHLITQVETRPAIEQDNEATADIQNQLVKSELCPQQHLVDAGYVIHYPTKWGLRFANSIEFGIRILVGGGCGGAAPTTHKNLEACEWGITPLTRPHFSLLVGQIP